MYTCADCGVMACCKEDREKMPKNCPIRDSEMLEKSLSHYSEPENRDFYIMSSAIEAIGYGSWTRLIEIVELCKRLEYKKVGLAFCMGLKKEGKIISDVLRAHGLEVVSVICKAGGVAKEEAQIPKELKLVPEEFESMCNPIFQAELLNREQTELNVVVGLCVGHDSMFYKYSKALATTLITKDRVLAHNPAGAVYCAEGYYKKKLAPEKRL